jgi:tetrahydromethanopterin S-methyltransferase subunit C
VIERYYSKSPTKIQAPTTSKSIVRFVIATLFALVFTAALAGDFEDGKAAYDRRDYATGMLSTFVSINERLEKIKIKLSKND